MNNIFYLPPRDESFCDQLDRLFPDDNRKTGTITFQVTENCNLACTYCYQNNKSKNKMTFNIAKKVIDDLLLDKYPLINRNNTKALAIEFIGGEPLLEIELIQEIVDYYFNQALLLNHEWVLKTRVGICSNGVLYFNEKVQKYFQKYKYLTSFCISIDGNKELHDSCRIDFHGNGSYDKAMAAAHHYRNNYIKNINTKMTLSPENLDFLYEALINLIKNKYTIVHLNCVFEDVWSLKDAKKLYEKLIEIGDYLINNNLYNKINLSIFNENIGQPMLEANNHNWCGGNLEEQSSFAVDPNGILYSCVRFMDSSLNGKQPPLNFGDISHGFFITEEEINNSKKLLNITRRSQSTDECFYCSVAEGCSWCTAYNYEETGSPNKRVTYICDMHKARVLANVYYWNKLYQKLKIQKTFKNNLSKNEIIQIIGEQNYCQLKIIIGGE